MESVYGSMRFINALKLYAKLSMYVHFEGEEDHGFYEIL